MPRCRAKVWPLPSRFRCYQNTPRPIDGRCTCCEPPGYPTARAPRSSLSFLSLQIDAHYRMLPVEFNTKIEKSLMQKTPNVASAKLTILRVKWIFSQETEVFL